MAFIVCLSMMFQWTQYVPNEDVFRFYEVVVNHETGTYFLHDVIGERPTELVCSLNGRACRFRNLQKPCGSIYFVAHTLKMNLC